MQALSVNSWFLVSSKRSLLFSLFQVLAASSFLTFCAHISVPLPFNLIPLSGQTFAVMLIGASLGPRKGLLSVLLYLFEGICGLPVFAGGGFGLARLLGPSGGYLIGFLLQVYLVGYFMERKTVFQTRKTLPVMLFSCLIQLGLGVLWLSTFVSFKPALIMGLYPFLGGEALKSLFISFYLKMQPKP